MLLPERLIFLIASVGGLLAARRGGNRDVAVRIASGVLRVVGSRWRTSFLPPDAWRAVLCGRTERLSRVSARAHAPPSGNRHRPGRDRGRLALVGASFSACCRRAGLRSRATEAVLGPRTCGPKGPAGRGRSGIEVGLAVLLLVLVRSFAELRGVTLVSDRARSGREPAFARESSRRLRSGLAQSPVEAVGLNRLPGSGERPTSTATPAGEPFRGVQAIGDYQSPRRVCGGSSVNRMAGQRRSGGGERSLRPQVPRRPRQPLGQRFAGS
jgi:hypothetical protein